MAEPERLAGAARDDEPALACALAGDQLEEGVDHVFHRQDGKTAALDKGAQWGDQSRLGERGAQGVDRDGITGQRFRQGTCLLAL
jgi:hypothetical protein